MLRVYHCYFPLHHVDLFIQTSRAPNKRNATFGLVAHSTQLTGPKSRLLEADSDSSDKEISHFHKTRLFITGSSYSATSCNECRCQCCHS